MREIDAVVESLKRDASQQVQALRRDGRRTRRRASRLEQREQIRRFLAGEEEGRLERGEISAADWRAYEERMLNLLRRQGALEE